MAEKAYIRKFKIRRGLLKGVGLKRRHRRQLKREFKKTLRSYVGRPAALAAGAAAALVSKQIRAMQGIELPGNSLPKNDVQIKCLPEKKQP